MLLGGLMMGFIYVPNWYAAGKRHASDILGEPMKFSKPTLLWPGTWPYFIAYHMGFRNVKRNAEDSRD
jgi:hypothetical protein